MTPHLGGLGLCQRGCCRLPAPLHAHLRSLAGSWGHQSGRPSKKQSGGVLPRQPDQLLLIQPGLCEVGVVLSQGRANFHPLLWHSLAPGVHPPSARLSAMRPLCERSPALRGLIYHPDQTVRARIPFPGPRPGLLWGPALAAAPLCAPLLPAPPRLQPGSSCCWCCPPAPSEGHTCSLSMKTVHTGHPTLICQAASPSWARGTR